MKYGEILGEEQIAAITMAEHITEEQKIHIARALNQDIDDRFAGFKHCFTSRGRMYHDHESLEKEKYMDPFCLDQTKIKQSKAFRRLSDKAQVMPIIERESHMRNRQIHTREVEDLASQFCDMINHLFDKHKIPIRVNKELCKSQALGHDIGHAPFGHAGERFLQKEKNKPFAHNIFGVMISETIEREGKGLNLTPETKSGILHHDSNGEQLSIKNHPQEDVVTRIMDKIAYLGSDLNDSIRRGFLKKDNKTPLGLLGDNQKERDYNLLKALAEQSFKYGFITFGKSKEGQIVKDMKALLFEKYYFQKDKERKIRYHDMLDRVYSFFEREYPEVDPVISTALLTDREVFTISELLRDNPKMQYQDLPSNIGICEILHHIKGVKMDQNTTK